IWATVDNIHTTAFHLDSSSAKRYCIKTNHCDPHQSLLHEHRNCGKSCMKLPCPQNLSATCAATQKQLPPPDRNPQETHTAKNTNSIKIA
ncbi:hypothetical protein U9M48_026852, partial [Paspalum notatum var. saurae]